MVTWMYPMCAPHMPASLRSRTGEPADRSWDIPRFWHRSSAAGASGDGRAAASAAGPRVGDAVAYATSPHEGLTQGMATAGSRTVAWQATRGTPPETLTLAQVTKLESARSKGAEAVATRSIYGRFRKQRK